MAEPGEGLAGGVGLSRHAVLRLLFLSDRGVHRRRNVADRLVQQLNAIEAAPSPSSNRADSHAAGNRTLALRAHEEETSAAADDVSPVKHHKRRVFARQRNNYEGPRGYGNALGYAQEIQYGPKRLFSNW
jgi:hypothetical protein